MEYSLTKYRDSETGRYRWAALHKRTAVFYFANSYGMRAAKALVNRLNSDAEKPR